MCRVSLVALQLNYFFPIEKSHYVSDAFDKTCLTNNGLVVISRKTLQLFYQLLTFSSTLQLDWQDIPTLLTTLCDTGRVTDVLTFLSLFQDWTKFEKFSVTLDNDDHLNCCLKTFSEIGVKGIVESIFRNSIIPNDYAYKSVCIINHTEIHRQKLLWYQYLVDMIVSVQDIELSQNLKSRFALICAPSPTFKLFLSQSCSLSQLVRHWISQDRVDYICNFAEFLLSSDSCISYDSMDLILIYLAQTNHKKEYEVLSKNLRSSYKSLALLEYA
jgi:hypothetical protein